jgi:hypothetical protein
MLLLSGPDYRFFHFNIVITFSLIVALLAKARKKQTTATAGQTEENIQMEM